MKRKRTVALAVGIHDEHQTPLHLGTKPNADPRIRWAGEIDEDIVRVVRNID